MENPCDDSSKLQWIMTAQAAFIRAAGSICLPLGARSLVGEALDLALDVLCGPQCGEPPL